MSNPVSNFFHFILHVKAKVSDFLVHLFGAQTASEIGHAALNVLANTKIGSEILKYVEEFNSANLSQLENDVKHAQVVTKARAFAAAHGINISDSLINLLIEFAVAKIKGYFEAAGPHDPNNQPSALPPDPATPQG